MSKQMKFDDDDDDDDTARGGYHFGSENTVADIDMAWKVAA